MSGHIEPATTLVDILHVRREADLETITTTLLTLLTEPGSVVDLSHYDQRADTIEVRTTVSQPET